jgi:hypothetical protein
MMARVYTPRNRRLLDRTRDYIARLGSRQEAMHRVYERDLRDVEERMVLEGRLAVDFLAPRASMLTITESDGSFDVGARIAEAVGAELEGDAWPDMRLDVRMIILVFKSPPSVADTFLDG